MGIDTEGVFANYYCAISLTSIRNGTLLIETVTSPTVATDPNILAVAFGANLGSGLDNHILLTSSKVVAVQPYTIYCAASLPGTVVPLILSNNSEVAVLLATTLGKFCLFFLLFLLLFLLFFNIIYLFKILI